MATQNYNTVTPRIGKIKGAVLKHAVAKEVLGITGKQHNIDKNQSDTVSFRRWLPKGGSTTNSTTINTISVDATAHLQQEGVTPEADTITPQDISVQLNQYSCMYMYTDKTADLYEDKIPDEMKIQCGERMAVVREMIRYGTLKGATNKYYAGGTTRGTVDETISLNILRNVSRGLSGNYAEMVTRVLSPSQDFNTTAIEAGYIVFAHTDAEHDIRELPGYIPLASYGQRKPIHPLELGSVERYRFILSPLLAPIIDSGAALGSTGLESTGNSLIDVYPFIVVAEDAWGDVALRGMRSFKINHLPHNQPDKSDPGGQRGYLHASFWSAMFMQNDGWAAVIEAGVTDL